MDTEVIVSMFMVLYSDLDNRKRDFDFIYFQIRIHTMNNTDQRLLYLSEKKVQEQRDQIRSLEVIVKEKSEKIHSLEQVNELVKHSSEEQKIQLDELQRQVHLLEQERLILLKQIQDQQAFIVGMNELSQSSVLRRIEVVQRLEYATNEYNKLNDQVTKLSSRQAEIEFENNNFRLQSDQQQLELQQSRIYQSEQQFKWQQLLSEREAIIKNLQTRIQSYEEFSQPIQDVIDDYSDTASFQNQNQNAYIRDLEVLVAKLQNQVQVKEAEITKNQQYIVQLQSKPAITQEAVIAHVPEFLRNKVIQLQNLTQIVPNLIEKIAQAHVRIEDQNQKIKELNQAKHQIQQLKQEIQRLEHEQQQINDQYQFCKQQLEKHLTENWALKKYMINSVGRDQTINIVQSLDIDVNSPFSTHEALITDYNRLKAKQLKQAQEAFRQI